MTETTTKNDIEWKNPQGELHRDGDLPAAIKANGDKYWYQNRLKHRDGDLSSWNVLPIYEVCEYSDW